MTWQDHLHMCRKRGIAPILRSCGRCGGNGYLKAEINIPTKTLYHMAEIDPKGLVPISRTICPDCEGEGCR